MRLRLSDLWRWDGVIDRGPFVVWGVLLLALKYNIDRFVASEYFGRYWSFWNYFFPDASLYVGPMPGDGSFYATILLISIPFLWTGSVLTVRRLRSAGMPLGLAMLFFVPFVKLFLFLILAIAPPHERHQTDHRPTGIRNLLDRVIPDHPLGAAGLAMMLSVAVAVALGAISTRAGAATYGWGLFVGTPFVLGMGSALIYGYHRPRSLASCIGVANLSLLLLGVVFLLMAFEGAICLLMAAPIGCAIATLGGMVGYVIQNRPGGAADVPPILPILLLLLPLAIGAEKRAGRPDELYAVHTEVTVDAPPETVWRHVVSFSELTPPVEPLFRLGIAYPIRAEIRGQGVGAVRYCQFSTGPFVEPIEVWDAPRLLKFSVTDNPAPMEEWTPYREVHPPHLDGFLLSNGGQFRLERLPDQRTRIEGTTWYRHHMAPGQYWKLWSDAIIHRIHMRVLNHVKRLSENDRHALTGSETGS